VGPCSDADHGQQAGVSVFPLQTGGSMQVFLLLLPV